MADDLIEILSRLPWWAGAGLALISYLVLHGIAVRGVGTPANTADMGHFAARGFGTALATIGQYILPLICAVGAIASALTQRKRVRLVADVASGPTASVLGNMTWQEFELLVGEALRRQGYAVDQRGGNGPDGGIDLVLSRGAEKTLLQCKQWRAQRVGVNVVRELYGIMAARGAAAGIVVTAGSYTPDATEFANGRNMQLIDGPALFEMIRKARQVPSSVSQGSKPPSTVTAMAPPACPRCGQEMVRRETRCGANIRQAFWGRSCLPACRGTVAIEQGA